MTQRPDSTDSDALTTVARSALELERRRQLHEELRASLHVLSGPDLFVVAGEQELLEEIEELLERARQLFQQLSTASELARDDCLAELRHVLSAPAWQTGKDVSAELAKKAEQQIEQVRDLQGKIEHWRNRVREATTKIEQALNAKAPVSKERRDLLELDALIFQAERDIRAERYIRALSLVRDLGKPGLRADELAKKGYAKQQAESPFTRLADVMLMRADDGPKRHRYSVLFRTPSEPGSHGINIEDSSTVVLQDRTLLTEIVNEISEAVQGRLRTDDGHATTNTVQPPLSARELTVDQSGQPAAPADVRALVTELGALLYRVFLPESMQRHLSDYDFSLLVISNDLELPWELMHDGERFVSLRRPIARMPLGRAEPRRPVPRSGSTKPTRFLLILSDPSNNLPNAEEEICTIADGLEADWNDIIDVDVLENSDVTGREMNQRLLSGRYDVIHYAGHASFDRQSSELSGLLLQEGEVFYAQKIRRLLNGRPLVFLNACESGRTQNESDAPDDGPTGVGSYFAKPAEGLASAFIYGGALACIGALWPVNDRHAAEFAVDFYSKVLEGYMIGQALKSARIASERRYPNEITWASFMMYGDPTMSLMV